MKKGFTLIETLVSIALFSILVAIAVGGFTTALRTQREVAGLIATQSNASLAMEQVAREIRTGYLFCDVTSTTPTFSAPCASYCSANGNVWTCNALDFYNAQGLEVNYSLSASNALERSEGGGLPQPITGDNVAVKYLKFTLFGNIEADTWNPRITVSMGVGPVSNDPVLASSTLNLQTTISARGIDCSSDGSC